MTDTDSSTPRLARERARLLIRFRQWMEVPLLVLGFVWLVLLVVELTSGLHPMLESLSTTIWIIFIAAFLVELALAPGGGRSDSLATERSALLFENQSNGVVFVHSALAPAEG